MIRPAFARALVCLCLMLAPLPALAHKVIASVFPSGDRIEGEVGFSDGTPAAGLAVEVFDADGSKLGEAVTDSDGFFTYAPTAPVTHVFRANLGAGHVAETTMSADDVAPIAAKAAAATGNSTAQNTAAAGASLATGLAAGRVAPILPQDAPAGSGTPPAATARQSGAMAPQTALAALPATGLSLSPAEHDAIARIVRDEMRPLRREIAAYREKNDIQQVLGGIGYIVGLVGIGYFVAARRRLERGA